MDESSPTSMASGVSQLEPPSLFRWNVSDSTSRALDQEDYSGGPSPQNASTRISPSTTPSSGAQSPVRGRPVGIADEKHGLVSRATARRRAGPTPVDFDIALMQTRISSRDFTADREDRLGSVFLEPYAAGRDFRSSSVAVFGHTVHGFSGHRDTFAILTRLPKLLPEMPELAPEIPLDFFFCLRDHISHADYLSLRLSCREWYSAISYVSPPKLPTVYFLPAEIVQQIYTYLRPVDFNAARHTCRAWLLASLDEHILTCMLRRGGWGDILLYAPSQGSFNAGAEGTSTEWALSKLLARECSLGSRWTGNGLRDAISPYDSHTAGDSSDAFYSQDASYAAIDSRDYADTSLLQGRDFNGLSMISRVDFSALGSGYAGDNQQGAAVNFTVSVCGKYLLVSEGCMIFVYRLSSDNVVSGARSSVSLTVVTSVICPRRVLAVSMDTSSQRFAVAALLDGRMGLVCDLDEIAKRKDSQSTARTSSQSPAGFHVAVSPSSMSSPLNRAFVRSSGTAGEREITEPALRDRSLTDPSMFPGSQASHRVYDSASGTSEHVIPGAFARERGVNLETGSRSVYKNLCSDDDPPRSVAICPQRRCVAFGCSAGIELHWVDALTGQDLNRWFPLTAPSDFLYFLPPRKGVDSAKKLRLISSAAHPNEKPAMRHHFQPAQTMSHLMWGPLRFTGQVSGVQTSSDCDHYRAVPLSDGNHILFTDPATGMLCLGSDAPLGGPTKLLRKIMLVGPEGFVPSVYTAGAELRQGVRVVAGYRDRVFLFSIPPDVFRDSKFEGTTETLWQEDSWHHYLDEDDTDASIEQTLWPVKIRGTEIGRVSALSDLAIDSSSKLTIWAFSANGEAFVWKIDDGSPKRMTTIWIRQDGTVDTALDPDGDTIMGEVSPLEEDRFRRTAGFDGTSSVSFPFVSSSEPVVPSSGFAHVPGREDEDVEMVDADTLDHGDSEFAQAGGILAVSVPSVEARWSEDSADWVPDYLQGQSLDDGILALLGIAGLDFEVL
ncbi:hypothetical protein MMC16_003394 [Acarospora aff. strigata]|nr:hypothetical protein [Acarospora aff. strigata]